MGIKELIRDIPIEKTREEIDADPRIESLRLALETSTPNRGGTPWEHEERGKKKVIEPELI